MIGTCHRFLWCCLALLLVAGCSKDERCSEVLKSEVQQLEQTRLIYERGAVPTAWSAGIFLSNNDLLEAFSVLRGSGVSRRDDESVALNVTDLFITGKPGVTQARLKIDVRKRSAAIGLDVVANVEYRRTEVRGPKAEPVMILGLRIVRISPRVFFSIWSWFGGNIADDPVVRDLLYRYIGGYAVPLPSFHTLFLPLGLDRNEQVRTDDGKGYFALKSVMPDGMLGVNVTLAAPLATSKGVWLLATDDHQPLPTIDPATLSGDCSKLRDRRRVLNAEIAAKERAMPATDPSSGLWVGSTLFNQLGAAFNALSDNQRTVAFSVSNIDGNLVDKIDGPKHLEGGYRAKLTQGSGRLQLGKATFRWDNGFTLDLRATAHASARVDLHVDPYVGGGFTKNIGIDGHGRGLLKARLLTRLISAEGRKALVVGPVFDCSFARLEIKGGGALEYGIRTSLPLGDRPARPQILAADYRSIVVDLGATTRKQHLIWRGQGSGRRYLALVPRAPSISQSGYWLPADVVRQADPTGSVADVKRREDEIDDAVINRWSAETTPECPSKPADKFLFAGQDFGPNNEIVKALKKFGEELQRHGANLEQAKDDIDRITRHPDQIDDVAKDVGRRTAAEAARVAKKAKDITDKLRDALPRPGIRLPHL